jgi:hypothetical protein
VNSQRMLWSGLLALVLMGATAEGASAQVFVAPAPVTSFFVPAAPVVATPVMVAPVVSYYTVPAFAPAPVMAAPVSFFTPAVPVAPVAAPVPAISSVPATVGFFNPVAVPYNYRVSRGLFGRTIIRTPFSVTRF